MFLKIILIIVLVVLAIVVFFYVLGTIIKSKGQGPIDMVNLHANNGKLAQTADGRNIEYFTYGAEQSNKPIMINLHGSSLEGVFEKEVHHEACTALGVKGISITLPGCGNTDMKKGRVVIDWSSEDLDAVLRAENVDSFMISGHSQGNPHAMAAAYHFKERCVGLGLNAPLLPNDVTKEVGIKGALANGSLKTTAQLENPINNWFFGVVPFFTKLFGKITLVKSGKNLGKDKKLLAMIDRTLKRFSIRGYGANVWESTLDVCYEWGFDPREIPTKNICVWHAKDDSFCPPEIGEWLANYYSGKGALVNFKNDDIGMNHMTFCSSHYRQPENSMVKALLNGLI